MPRTHRRLLILDAMVLILALALSAGLIRGAYRIVGPISLSTGTQEGRAHIRIALWGLGLLPWAPVLYLLEKIRAGAARQGTYRSEAATTCGAASLALAASLPLSVLLTSPPSHGPATLDMYLLSECGVLPLLSAATVLLSWFGIAFRKERQLGASWIDRAGRLLGALWVAFLLVYILSAVCPDRPPMSTLIESINRASGDTGPFHRYGGPPF